MNTSTHTQDTTVPQIVGWLLTYTNDEVDFIHGSATPQHLSADCDEIIPVVSVHDAVVYARTHAAIQRKRIEQLEKEVSRLKQREHTCATMDQAEKIALVRALQECADALGLDTNTTPADLVKAVTAASDAAYIDETEIIGAELALMCIEGQDMQHWTDACDVATKNVLKRLIAHNSSNKKEATHG